MHQTLRKKMLIKATPRSGGRKITKKKHSVIVDIFRTRGVFNKSVDRLG